MTASSPEERPSSLTGLAVTAVTASQTLPSLALPSPPFFAWLSKAAARNPSLPYQLSRRFTHLSLFFMFGTKQLSVPAQNSSIFFKTPPKALLCHHT